MRLPWISKSYIYRKASKITQHDIDKAINSSDSIRNKFESAGPLRRYLDDIKILICLLRDYWTGEYRAVPWWAIGAIAFSLLYVISPVDLIPDFIPVIGYVDDAAVVSVCLVLVEEELKKYRKWKSDQNRS